jgi:leader peptidase (prepilin peptidase)/N-methyltransferase
VNGLLTFFAAGFGAIIGSFLNVVIHRLPRGEPMGMSRSKCPKCSTQIAARDNIPLLSWLLLLGRCRACRARISLRYPLVEALTAALFALAWRRAGLLGWEPIAAAFPAVAGFLAVLVAASFIDWDLKILPDRLTLRAGPLFALLGVLLVPGIHGTSLFGEDLARAMKPGLASLVVGLAGAVAGGGVILLIRQAGTLLLKREAMGLGDVKLMATCGLLLGPLPVLLAIGVAMVVGSVIGVGIWIATKNREIPFGPFLAFGAMAVLLYGDPIRHFVFVTYPGLFRG